MKIQAVKSSNNHRLKKIRRLKEMLLKYHRLDKRMVCQMVRSFIILKIKSYLNARVLKLSHLNQIDRIKNLKKQLKIITVKLLIQLRLQILKYIPDSSLEENLQVSARIKKLISSLAVKITNIINIIRIKPQITNTLEKGVIQSHLNCSHLQTTFTRKSRHRLPDFTLSK